MAQHRNLQVVTYHWSEANNSMIYVSTPKIGRQDYPPSATASEGVLNQLPLEIIHNVLGQLEVSTIGSVRSLNQRSRFMVNSCPMYRDLALHASSVLRVLYSTHLESTYSVKSLYKVLTNDRCICWNAFGPYLSLIACERCCFSCLHDTKMAPTTLSSAASAFRLSKNEIEKNIPVVTTLPGTYTIERFERKRALKVVSVRRTLALALQNADRTQLGREELAQRLYKKAEDLTRHYNDPIRFLVSTPIPYFNTRNQRSEAGVWCRGCELVWYRRLGPRFNDIKRFLNTAYLEKEYLNHFDECDAAKELWELFLLEGKGLEHVHRGRHREWASRITEKPVQI